jgi:hypothetical protein
MHQSILERGIDMFVLIEAAPANHATELRPLPDVSANISGDIAA